MASARSYLATICVVCYGFYSVTLTAQNPSFPEGANVENFENIESQKFERAAQSRKARIEQLIANDLLTQAHALLQQWEAELNAQSIHAGKSHWQSDIDALRLIIEQQQAVEAQEKVQSLHQTHRQKAKQTFQEQRFQQQDKIEFLKRLARFQEDSWDFDSATETLRRLLLEDLSDDERQMIGEKIEKLHQRKHDLLSTKRKDDTRLGRAKADLVIEEYFTAADISQPLQYAADFIAKTKQRASRQQIKDPRQSWALALEAKLKQPITVHYDQRPIPEILTDLKAKTDLSLAFGPGLAPDDDQTFSLSAEQIPLKNVLQWVAEHLGLHLHSHQGQVIFDEADQVYEDNMNHVYNVSDLLLALVDYLPPEINLAGDESGVDLSGSPEESEVFGSFDIDELAELVQNSVHPTIWGNQASIASRGSNLIVNAPFSVQQDVRQFLDAMRADRSLQVQVKFRFLTLSDKDVERMGVDWRGLNIADRGADLLGLTFNESTLDPNNVSQGDSLFEVLGFSGVSFRDPASGVTTLPASLFSAASGIISDGSGRAFARGRQYSLNRTSSIRALFPDPNTDDHILDSGLNLIYSFLDSTQYKAILQASRNHQQSKILDMPVLTCFNTQRALLSHYTQQAYVQDVTAVVAVQVAVFDPEIGYLTTANILDVRPVISHDRKWISLDLRPTRTEFLGLQQLAVPADNAGISGTSAIELPNIKMTSIRTNVLVPDGGTVMVGGLGKHARVKDYTGGPFMSRIPILNFLTGSHLRGHHEVQDYYLVSCTIIDHHEMEEAAFGVTN